MATHTNIPSPYGSQKGSEVESAIARARASPDSIPSAESARDELARGIASLVGESGVDEIASCIVVTPGWIWRLFQLFLLDLAPISMIADGFGVDFIGFGWIWCLLLDRVITTFKKSAGPRKLRQLLFGCPPARLPTHPTARPPTRSPARVFTP